MFFSMQVHIVGSMDMHCRSLNCLVNRRYNITLDYGKDILKSLTAAVFDALLKRNSSMVTKFNLFNFSNYTNDKHSTILLHPKRIWPVLEMTWDIEFFKPMIQIHRCLEDRIQINQCSKEGIQGRELFEKQDLG